MKLFIRLFFSLLYRFIDRYNLTGVRASVDWFSIEDTRVKENGER